MNVLEHLISKLGEKLLEIKAPTSAMATPMSYMANGRQYVVIATGGHMWNYPNGISDELIAYALPEKLIK